MATKTAAKPRATGVKLLTILMPEDEQFDLPEGADIIHEQDVTLDEPELSSSGNSYKACFASVSGTDAPQATVRIDGKVVKLPLTIAVNAYFSKKAVDKAMGRR